MRRLHPMLLLLLAAGLFRFPVTPAHAQEDPCQRGMALFRRQQLAAAESLLTRCVAAEDRLEPLLALCAIDLIRERPADAVQWADRAVAAAPDSAAAYYWYGRCQAALGDRPAAEQAWNRALSLDAGHAATLEALARSKLAVGEDQAAYGLLTQLVRVTGGSPWASRLLSQISRRRGLWDQALRHWRDALAGGTPSAEDYRTAGELAILAEDTTYAVTAARLAVAADSSAASLAILGEALFAAHRLAAAVPVLEEAVRRDPQLPRARFNLANVYELLGRTGDAEREFRTFVRLQPDDPMGHLNLAAHLDGLGRTREALAELDRATALDGSQTGAWILKGRILEKLGDDERLLALLDTLAVQPGVDTAQVARWRRQAEQRHRETLAARREGKMLLLHIVTPDSVALDSVLAGLRQGRDFGELATRFSVGPTAAQGGPIGWVDPRDMVADLRRVIEPLRPQQVSPPVRSGGLYHLFKRVQ